MILYVYTLSSESIAPLATVYVRHMRQGKRGTHDQNLVMLNWLLLTGVAIDGYAHRKRTLQRAGRTLCAPDSGPNLLTFIAHRVPKPGEAHQLPILALCEMRYLFFAVVFL